MTPAPAPDVIDINSAMEAYHRFANYVVGTIESLNHELRGDDAERAIARGEAIESGRRCVEFVLVAIDVHTTALRRLVDELRADRYTMAAALGALIKQGSFQREQLQADYLEVSVRLWDGLENVPSGRRDIAWLIGSDPAQGQH